MQNVVGANERSGIAPANAMHTLDRLKHLIVTDARMDSKMLNHLYSLISNWATYVTSNVVFAEVGAHLHMQPKKCRFEGKDGYHHQMLQRRQPGHETTQNVLGRTVDGT
jgi:hypothetical protein